MHQSMLCFKMKEKKLNHGAPDDTSSKLKGQYSGWVEVLVSEICCLCIRRNLVDRMIELPWNSDEEKYIHKCLLDHTIGNPQTCVGSLLLVFYIQCYRYAEAYQVHLKLENVEKDSISEGSVGEEVLSRVKTATHWRAKLVDRCLGLLPDVEQQQLKSGKLAEGAAGSCEEVEMPAVRHIEDSRPTSFLIPPSGNSSLVLDTDHANSLLRSTAFEMSTEVVGPLTTAGTELGNFGSSSLPHDQLFSTNERGLKHQGSIVKSLRYDSTSTPRNHRIHFKNGSPQKGVSRTSPGNSPDNMLEVNSQRVELNPYFGHNQNTSPLYLLKATANSVSRSTFSHSYNDDRSWNVVSSDDPMDAPWSHMEKNSAIKESNINGGTRWRSDEISDDEEEPSLERARRIAYRATPSRTRRSRFSKG